MENKEIEIQKCISKMSYGLYIVSSALDGKPNGQLVNTVFQTTANPPRVAASINKVNLTHDCIKQLGLFSVSIMAQDAPMPFIGMFGFRTGRDFDKFAKAQHKDLAGCPVVTENALVVYTVKVENAVDMGTHTLFMGPVVEAETLRDAPALTYDYYKVINHGRTQKNATTYVEPSQG